MYSADIHIFIIENFMFFTFILKLFTSLFFIFHFCYLLLWSPSIPDDDDFLFNVENITQHEEEESMF